MFGFKKVVATVAVTLASIAVPGRWRSVLDGREHDLAGGERVTALAGGWPVAMLERA